ncbi:MAG: hypothetical protein JSS94_07125 [Bacteroidetes bacterium]|nr:hypothetical protein [Bacteroidota bacterium]
MKQSKININQIVSPKGNTFLILNFDDKNTHENFEVYQLVQNASEVARDEFAVSEYDEDRRSKLNTREMWKKILKIIPIVLLILIISCQKKDEIQNISEKESIDFSVEKKSQNSEDTFDITEGIWSSMNQLSNAYINNGIYDVVTSLKFNKNGTVEIYEGNTDAKSCICTGFYTLENNKKTLKITNVNNQNCSWMNKLNGTYSYSKDVLDSFTNNENGIRIDL